MGRAFPFPENSENLLPLALVVPVLSLIEVNKNRVLSDTKLDSPFFIRWAINTEELSGVHIGSEDLLP